MVRSSRSRGVPRLRLHLVLDWRRSCAVFGVVHEDLEDRDVPSWPACFSVTKSEAILGFSS